LRETNTTYRKFPVWLALLLILGAAAWIRWHLLGVPLERDEGEYAYGGQLLLQGIPPYTLLYNMKLPGIYAAYAGVLALFGQSPWGIHLGLLVINSLTGILIFLIGRRLLGALGGLASAAVFMTLAMGQPVQGIFANAEHFVLLPAMLGVFLLLLALDNDRPWLFLAAGFMLGMGFIIKQHGLFFIVWGGVFGLGGWFCSRPWGGGRRLLSRAGLFVLGVFLPYVITCILLYKAGVFDKFWFWTFEYARAYSQQVPLAGAWNMLKLRTSEIVGASPWLWLSAAIGFFVVLWRYRNWRQAGFLLSLTLFSLLAVSVGGYFRPHYFILLLPAVSLLAGSVFAALAASLAESENPLLYAGLPCLLLSLCLGLSLYKQRHFLFSVDAEQASRETYWPNPFVESLPIADYLRKQAKSGDRLAVIGSEPQLYFYSGMKSATGYIYMYPLMEGHDFALTMQKEMIKEIEAVRPEYLIFVRIDLSWLQRSNSHTQVYKWFENYVKDYKRVGMVEIFDQQSRYSWQPDVIWPPKSPYWIEIMKRKDE
jgi:general stress protein CsbA